MPRKTNNIEKKHPLLQEPCVTYNNICLLANRLFKKYYPEAGCSPGTMPIDGYVQLIVEIVEHKILNSQDDSATDDLVSNFRCLHCDCDSHPTVPN